MIVSVCSAASGSRAQVGHDAVAVAEEVIHADQDEEHFQSGFEQVADQSERPLRQGAGEFLRSGGVERRIAESVQVDVVFQPVQDHCNLGAAGSKRGTRSAQAGRKIVQFVQHCKQDQAQRQQQRHADEETRQQPLSAGRPVRGGYGSAAGRRLRERSPREERRGTAGA